MTTKIPKPIVRLALMLGTLLSLLLLGLLFDMAWPASPVQAGATLPPRDPPADHAGRDDNGDQHAEPAGGYIALRVSPVRPGLWTVVQWADQAGQWHAVEGWQGTLDQNRQKVWWVAPADFNKGPFRWAVYRGQAGPLLAASRPFTLPAAARETVRVAVLLEEAAGP